MFTRRSPYVEDYLRRIAMGDGTGRGEHYRPYLRIQDVPSSAIRSRIYFPRFKRVVHVLSHSELSGLLLFEWNDNVVEIREQFPLDPEITLGICLRNGIRHPMMCGRRIVMTSDFLVTYRTGVTDIVKAYQIKASHEEANRPRTLEKLKVEEEYWNHQGIEWKLLVATDFNRQFVENLEAMRQLRAMRFSAGALSKADDFLDQVRGTLRPQYPIQRMAQIEIDMDGHAMNGFQTAVLLIAKKMRAAPIQETPLSSLTVGQLEEVRKCC